MKYDNSLWRSQLRHRPLQLQSFINACANKGFDLLLAKGGQHTSPESANETLGTRKTYPVSFVRATIEHLDSFLRHHSHELGLAIAFKVMVSEHCDRGESEPHQHIQQRLHFIRPAEVGQVPGENEHI